jgi:rod shape-determining protein MreB
MTSNCAEEHGDLAKDNYNLIIYDHVTRNNQREMDQAIVSYIRNKYTLLISERTAEHVKVTLGSAFRLKEEMTLTVQGLNLVSRLPEALELSSVEIREALTNSIRMISETMKDAIDETPPELGVDLMEFGICLSGGGSQLQGLPQRLSKDLRIRVWVAEDPLTCVARGAGQVLENLDENLPFLVGLEGRIS